MVALAGNFVIVRLGKYDTTRYDPEYTSDELEVYARILRGFPDWGGENAKGFVTVPPLKRTNGSLRNNAWNVPAKDAVEQVTGKSAQSYSWEWSDVPMDTPEDLKYAHDLAQRMLAYG